MKYPKPKFTMLSRRLFLVTGTALGALSARTAPTWAAGLATSYTWSTVPFGGGGFVDGFLYHPSAPDTLYARTDVGGAYRFDSAKKSWIPLQDFLSREDGDLKGVLAMAIDPQDASRLYLACGEYLGAWARDGAVLVSKDRGNSWSITPLPKGVKIGGNADGRGTGERLQVDPNLSSVLFLGTTQDGLFKSSDTGATFTSAVSPVKNISLVLFDDRSGMKGKATPVLYLGSADEPGGLYKSLDGGLTFTLIPDLPRLIPQRAVLDASGNLYVTLSNGRAPAGGTDGAVYRLDSKTNKWRDISPMKPGVDGVRFAYCGLDVASSKPDTVVVATMNRYATGDDIYVSEDAGAHWRPLGPKAVHATGKFHWMFKALGGRERMGNWMADVRIDPFNPEALIYGTGSGVWMTSDLGNLYKDKDVHFAFAVDNLEETVVVDMASPPAGATLYASMSDVSGAAWDDLTQSPKDGYFEPAWESNTSVDYAELAPQYVVRTANNKSTCGYASSDGGLTWIPFATTPRIEKDAKGQWHGAGDIVISAKGTALLWTPQKQGAYFSTDMGKTWRASSGWPAQSDATIPTAADRAVDGIFYAHDRVSSSLLISVDSGANFTPIVKGLPKVNSWETSSLIAAPGQVRDLWLAMPEGLFHSPNEKAPLTQLKSVDEAWRFALGKAPDGKSYHALYLWGKVKGQAGLWRSDDVGDTWIKLNDDRHRFGGLRAMCADPLEFGTLYLAPDGRGIVVGRPG